MVYIKTTNVISRRTTTNSLKKVQCPYCKTFLESVSEYTTAMICWQCDKEFRIEQDESKISNSDEYSSTKRTVLKGVIK